MSEQRISTYEGLFLFPNAVTSNMQEAVDQIKSLLKRADAKLLSLKKWDERRLAYEVKGNKRGVYFLVYFSAQRDKLAGIERDVNLSETILRAMMTRADHLPIAQIEAADGQAELADEIKLRAEQAKEGTGSSGGGSKVQSAAEREAEAAKSEKPATEEAPAAEAPEEKKEAEPAGA